MITTVVVVVFYFSKTGVQKSTGRLLYKESNVTVVYIVLLLYPL